MVDETPALREKQVEQLAFYIAQKKCLDLSDPGTGKTPPCCVLSYFVHARENGSTLWTMPKSLRKKNRKEMLRFTEFEPHQVVVLNTDRANLTKNWTGPTIESTRKMATWELEDGRWTHEIRLDETNDYTRFYWDDGGEYYLALGRGRVKKGVLLDKNMLVVKPKKGPDGLPIKKFHRQPEQFKDLIADAAEQGARAVLTTFSFASAHWERVLENFPDLDLLLVDELHMGYGGPESKQTESFYWINKHVSRFVGMTGTLINGRLDSAFPAIHVIRPEYYGGYHGFIYDHAAVTDDYGRVVKWKNEEKLGKIIRHHSIARTFEEVYGEEDVVFFNQYVDLDEQTREAYDQFHDNAMLELEDGSIIDGGSPGVALIRARQIMGHPETMLDPKKIPDWTEKDERIITELSGGQKTLIFAALQPEQERLLRLCRDHLGLRAELINANVSGAQRDRIDEMAQRGELDVIIGSGPTVAVGFNWEMFDLVIFASIDYMDTNILQAYRRASRGGRTTQLRVIFLRYSETVEDKIFKIVQDKSELANRVDPNRRILHFASYND